MCYITQTLCYNWLCSSLNLILLTIDIVLLELKQVILISDSANCALNWYQRLIELLSDTIVVLDLSFEDVSFLCNTSINRNRFMTMPLVPGLINFTSQISNHSWKTWSRKWSTCNWIDSNFWTASNLIMYHNKDELKLSNENKSRSSLIQLHILALNYLRNKHSYKSSRSHIQCLNVSYNLTKF